MNLKEKLQSAYQKIKEADKVLIVGHILPDADALASVSAMMRVSETLGSSVYAYTKEKISGAYRFIPHEERILDEHPISLSSFSVILTLDCGSIERTGLEKEIKELLLKPEGERPCVIEFDHHPSPPTPSYADIEVRLPEKASTTEIIYHFLKANHLEITKELADCILIGLMTDTGNFFHANSSKEALAISSEMLLLGASMPRIINHTVYNKNFTSLKVWGRVLENMVFNADTGLVVSALTQKEIDELLSEEQNGQADLFGDIVSFLNSLSGVSVALLLREKDGDVKGSLRTNSDTINVAKIAQGYGGGGHKKAAGFRVKGRLERTRTGWNIKR